ncbi:MAG: HDOD domain-containing protein [Fibrobacter sp.]|nr:HDOD domain-containing protein [Fibrobacter sp.]
MEQKSLLRALSALPTLSPVLHHISQIVENPQASASEIATALQLDPVISAKVLRLANSAWIGFSGRVSSIQNAVIILGARKLHSILIASQFGAISRGAEYPFSIIRFWRHSVVSALIAEAIARHLRRYETVDEHEIFAGALLHDIGKLVLATVSPLIVKESSTAALSKGIPFFEAEPEEHSHCRIGEHCARSWNLPVEIILCISGHHFLQKYAEHCHLLSIIHIADIMSHVLGYPLYPDETAPSIDPAALSYLQFPIEYLRVIGENVLKDQRGLEALMEIVE